MRTNSRILFSGLFVLLLAGMTACGTSGSASSGGLCGSEKWSQKNFVGLEKEDERYLGYPGETSYVTWSLRVDNVCTAVHSDVDVSINAVKGAPLTVVGSIWYGILHERPIQVTKVDLGGNEQHAGGDNFGIKDVYGDNPGMFIIDLKVSFPSTGDYDGDIDFVNDNVLKGRVLAKYHEPK